MNDTFATALANDTVRIERVLPGPIERVWSYLTDSDKRGQWLASGAMEPRVGGKVALHFLHAELSPEEAPIPEQYRGMECGHDKAGEITRFDPPHHLAMTWGDGPDVASSSEVLFELTSEGEEVLLVLTHRRLRTRKDMLGVSGGWHTHLGILVDRLNGRTPRNFWVLFERIKGEYEQRLPTG